MYRRIELTRTSRGTLTAERGSAGFTLVELLTLVAALTACIVLLAPAIAATGGPARSFMCMNNLRQATAAWQMYCHDYNGRTLLSSSDTDALLWMKATIDFRPIPQNHEEKAAFHSSPLFPYAQSNAALFRCAADASSVLLAGKPVPRVRSVSMSHAFGTGRWLGKVYGAVHPWRTYNRIQTVPEPSMTFLFAEEHPDSMNDGDLSMAATGNQPGDPPSAAWIVDMPASWHDGGFVLSMADGHAEVRHLSGTKVRPPVKNNNTLPLNVSAGDSWQDMQWLARRTTSLAAH